MAILNGDYRVLSLGNGLVVALQNTPTGTISGRLRVNHGGLHEREGEEGLAHFLEHAIVKGGGNQIALETAEKIMSRLGYFNATTSLHETRFPVGMLAEDLQQYLRIISDIVFCPRLDFSRVEQQRQRILREIADEPKNQDLKDFRNAFYGPNSPYTYSVLGKPEVIEKATPEDLRRFHKRGYSPNNADLILVGALPRDIDELVVTYFAQIPKGNGTKFRFSKNPDLQGKTVLHRPAPELLDKQSREYSSAHFSIALVAPPDDADDSYAVGALVQILGGDASSRLLRTVSEKMGLAYTIGSMYNTHNKAGSIDICGSVQATRAMEAIDAVFCEMEHLKEELVDPDVLGTLNWKKRYRLAECLETNNGRAAAIETFLDRGITPELHLQRISEVTPEMVREAANRYFPDKEYGKYVLLMRDPFK